MILPIVTLFIDFSLNALNVSLKHLLLPSLTIFSYYIFVVVGTYFGNPNWVYGTHLGLYEHSNYDWNSFENPNDEKHFLKLDSDW